MQAPNLGSRSCVVALLAIGACASQQRDSVGEGSTSPAGAAAPVCGLEQVCAPLKVHGAHDLHGAMARAAEAQRDKLFTEDDPRSGCFTCAEPEVYFSATLAAPRGDTLTNIYLSLSALAEETFREHPPRGLESAWAELHTEAAGRIEAARAEGSAPRCAWVSSYCASSPAFIEGFIPFAAVLLAREDDDRQLGYAKQLVVKLILRLNPPGAIPTVCRYIRGRARERARYKAVRDLCGYAAHYPEAHETLEWVATEDHRLADLARRCVGDAELLREYPGDGVPMRPFPASLPESIPATAPHEQ